MIHVHNGNKSIEEVRTIPLVRPKNAGKFWKGIPHGDLINSILNESERRKWIIIKDRFSVSDDGADMAAAFDIILPDLESPEGTQFALGILANNKRERALRMYAGATITVCRNGFVSGEILLNKKHTTQFDLEDGIEKSLDEYFISIRKMSDIINSLRNHVLSEFEYSYIMIEAGRKKLMPWSRIGEVDKEYRNPSFSEWEQWSSWALLNAFTYVAKRNPPRKQMDQINKFREMLPIDMVV